jgi:hypothetical protein
MQVSGEATILTANDAVLRPYPRALRSGMPPATARNTADHPARQCSPCRRVPFSGPIVQHDGFRATPTAIGARDGATGGAGCRRSIGIEEPPE